MRGHNNNFTGLNENELKIIVGVSVLKHFKMITEIISKMVIRVLPQLGLWFPVCQL